MDVSKLWEEWCSGECLVAPEGYHSVLAVEEILRRLAPKFRYVEFDWHEGDRWVEARIANAKSLGLSGYMLQSEYDLKGQCLLATLSDAAEPEASVVRFYLAPHPGLVDLNYQFQGSDAECKQIARKIADLLGYSVESM